MPQPRTRIWWHAERRRQLLRHLVGSLGFQGQGMEFQHLLGCKCLARRRGKIRCGGGAGHGRLTGGRDRRCRCSSRSRWASSIGNPAPSRELIANNDPFGIIPRRNWRDIRHSRRGNSTAGRKIDIRSVNVPKPRDRDAAACAQGPRCDAQSRGAVRALRARAVRRRLGQPRGAGRRAGPATQVSRRARSIIAHNDLPDIPFDQSINPYRGCEHGCVYCYARPEPRYLGLSAGIDFETKIFVKQDAARLLKESWPVRAMSAGRSRWARTRTPTSRWSAVSRSRHGARGPGRGTASGGDRHQVEPGHARHRPVARRWRAMGWPGSTCRSPRSTGASRARSSRAPPHPTGGSRPCASWRPPASPPA